MSLHARLNHAHQRGSVIILVVVVIVLIALAGTVYLQVARTDRAITRRAHHNNVDQVVTATVAQVRQLLKRDIVDPNSGQMLRYGEDANATTAFDYPWTHPDESLRGVIDRMHLATLTPDFSTPGDPRWRHLSRLSTDPFINPNDGSTLTGPHEDVSVDNPMLADTTGDGVGDALYQWAPLRQVGEIEYIAAARIIDASAMANINVATRMDGVSGVDGMLDVRGYYPTELRLDRLLSRTGAGDWSAELSNLLMRRGVDSPEQLGLDDIDPPRADDEGTRAGYWFQRARIWHDRTNEWSFADEIALRHRFALRDVLQVGDVEGAMPQVLRRDAPSERFYFQAVGASEPSPQAMAAYFQGGTGPIADRTFRNIRHLLTTRSGHTAIAPNWDVGGGQALFGDARPMKFDLLNTLREEAQQQQRMQRLYEITERIFLGGDRNYLELPDNEARFAAADLAANFHTYTTRQRQARGLQVGGRTFYGLRPLPFIREVYVQWIYEHEQEEEPEDPEAEPQFNQWRRLDQSLAIAIEIGNPFDEPIALTGADAPALRVAVTDTAGTPLISQPITGNVTLAPRDAAREQRTAVLYSNRAGVGANIVEDGRGENLDADLNLGNQTINLGADAIQAPLRPRLNNGRFDDRYVALQIQNSDGQWVTYDRFELRRTTTQQSFFETAQVIQTQPTPDPYHRHIQLSYARDGRNWRYLSNRNRQLSLERYDHIQENADPSDGDYMTTVPGFDDDEKPSEGAGPIQGDEALDNVQLAVAGRPMLSIAELGWVFMVGYYDGDDGRGDIPTRLSGRDGEGGYLDDFETRRLTLDFSREAALTQMPGAGAMPHAAVLMDVLTTLHPGYDGVDNDGSGQADQPHDDGQPAEQWIAGTINVNTAPPEVLAMVLPLVEPGGVDDIEQLVQRIIEYRDNPGNRPGLTGGLNIRANRPGIASIGELLYINPTGADNPEDMQRFGQSGDPADDRVQLYPLPEDLNGNGKQRLPVADSAPEKMARFHRLAQVLSTRSDVFIGYFLIRGYRVGEWDRGPVESARVVAVFDRSHVRGPDDEVRILGVYRLD